MLISDLSSYLCSSDLNDYDPELQRIEVEHKAQLLEEENGIVQPLRTLDQIMQDIALLTDSDKKENEEAMDRVSRMTIHSAKGLEFRSEKSRVGKKRVSMERTRWVWDIKKKKKK